MTRSNYWYLASYPKSGNTWCRIFILRYLQHLNIKKDPKLFNSKENNKNKFSINNPINIGTIASDRQWIDDQIGIESSDMSFKEIDKLKHLLEGQDQVNCWYKHRFHKIHDAFINPKNNFPNVTYKGCEGVIYIVRRPEDIAVSYSFHSKDTNFEKSVKFMLNKFAALYQSDESCGFQIRQFVGRWDDHVNSWLNQEQLPVLLVKYEDLKENAEIQFSRILSFLKIPIIKNILKEVVEECNFVNLKGKEIEEGGFLERNNPNSRFFRSGVVGEGKKYLTKRQLNEINTEFDLTLKKLKYTNGSMHIEV